VSETGSSITFYRLIVALYYNIFSVMELVVQLLLVNNYEFFGGSSRTILTILYKER